MKAVLEGGPSAMSVVATSRLLPGAAVESLRDESRELLLMIGKSINTASARLQGRKIEA